MIGGIQISHFISFHHPNQILHGQPVQPTLSFLQLRSVPAFPLTGSSGSQLTHYTTSFGLHLACISASFHFTVISALPQFMEMEETFLFPLPFFHRVWDLIFTSSTRNR
ncbi:hypothetical protein VNO77_26674 [Canavalia gladiata]|uniref:Uncharacterized protein n=1 Tax=Canavalia gladiata TaxID=3824 RepID=A0AAN9Q3K0_CANGL